MDAEENKHPLDAEVALSAAWRRFSLMERPFWVRVGPPPVTAYHKPVDEVTSRVSDHGADTVFDGIETSGVRLSEDAQAVGRLDLETSGLLLFTNDGTLLHRLTHPKYAVPRAYEVVLSSSPDDAALRDLQAGRVTLRDGHVPRPEVERVSDDPSGAPRLRVVLREGKYHEVRRAFAAIGAPVVRLHRTAYATVTLGSLGLGRGRALDDAESRALYASVGLEPPEDALSLTFDDPG